MYMETILEHAHQVSSTEADCFQRLRASALFRVLQDLAVEHSNTLGCGREMSREKGLYWVVSRMRAEFAAVPRYGQELTLRTWPGKQTRAMFPRYYDVRDRNGKLLVQASSAWLLIDAVSREMVLPQRSGLTLPWAETGTECALPGPLRNGEAGRQDTRTVRFSELDTNDHMNNTKYLDWMEDLLPREFHRDHRLESLQVNFLHELRQGDEAVLDWRLDGTCLTLRGNSAGVDRFRLTASYLPEPYAGIAP